MKGFLSETLNSNAPFIDKKVKGKTCPWLNESIKREMNNRDQLLRICLFFSCF